MYLTLVRLSLFLTNGIKFTTDDGDKTKVVGGLVGDAIDNSADYFGKKFRESLVDFGVWLLTGLFNIITPFVEWGSKSVIVVCIIIFYCNKDRKAISVAIVWFFVYIIFMMIRGVVI